MNLYAFFSSIGPVPALLLLFGLGLVIFEMFNPGFGVPGILGLVLLAAGVITTAKTALEALVMILALIVILGIALIFTLRSASKGRLSKTLVLSDSLDKSSGYIGTEELESFVGKEGIVINNLRPSGTAIFEGKRLDVVSEGVYIPKDTKVRVVKVSGRRVVVKEINKKIQEVL